jgi:8-oxo-dGTP diphosphatase
MERLWARRGVRGILLRPGRLLILRRRTDLGRWPGLWDLPGGGVNRGETPTAALCREIHEETGFRVILGRAANAPFEWVAVRDEAPSPSLVIIFRCASESRRGPILDPTEHTACAWISKSELPGYPLVPRLLETVESAWLPGGDRAPRRRAAGRSGGGEATRR